MDAKPDARTEGSKSVRNPHRRARPRSRGRNRPPPADWSNRVIDLLGGLLTGARLEVAADDGSVWTLGRGGPQARMRVRNAAVLARMLRNPALRFGEAYVDGEWEPDGSLLSVLEAGTRLLQQLDSNPLVHWIRNAAGKLKEVNDPDLSRHNVASHYERDTDLFRRFLDQDLHYSCAYFDSATATLEQAQQAKCAHIASKLDLWPGARVLDIGCGWGSLAMYLAEHHQARVVGITLSEEQYKVACERAAARGLRGRVEFRIEDFRETHGSYDAVVSVGMFEHVGRPQYPVFFNRIHELLNERGTALLHNIGRTSPPGGTNSWISRYVFPGGYVPAASETLAAIERSGLLMTDLEVLRLHYARTLSIWHQRFQQERGVIAERYGERFCRLWEFYLQVSEASFRWGDLVVHQYQLARRLERLPLRRDYLYRDKADDRLNEAAG
jgi:cyclopropane-fatty-acyl-phospholipid synthase